MKNFIVACSLIAAGTVSAAPYTINGSNTMYPLNSMLSAEYQKSRPGVQFRLADAGTNKGIAALIDGTTDIAAATRELKPEESRAIRKRFGRDAIAQTVAIVGVSIYLHPRNRVTSLSIEQISGIFTGQITNWKDVGGDNAPISVISFSNDTGRHHFMVDHVLASRPFAAAAVFSKPPAGLPPNQRLLEEEKQILKAVSENPHAIGYGDLKKVRLVKIAQIRTPQGLFWPTPEHLQAGRYPLARRLTYYVRPDAPSELRDFVSWAPAQTEIIRVMNFAPLK